MSYQIHSVDRIFLAYLEKIEIFVQKAGLRHWVLEYLIMAKIIFSVGSNIGKLSRHLMII